MCDYSLEFYRSRPAREGERYVTTRFRSGSIGFGIEGDCSTPVCVPHDARLVLDNLPTQLQKQTGEGDRAEVTFIEVPFGQYRDGVRFADGTLMSLQQLGAGVRAQVVDALSGRFEFKKTATESA